MNSHCVPVIFKDIDKRDESVQLDQFLRGEIILSTSNTLICKVARNKMDEIIIKSILPDERGILIILDEGWFPSVLLPNQKIKNITIFKKWHKPSKSSKISLCSWPIATWIERYTGVPVSIELTDDTVLRGNIIRTRTETERLKVNIIEIKEELLWAK